MDVNIYKIEYRTIDPETSEAATGIDNFYADSEDNEMIKEAGEIKGCLIEMEGK